MNEEYKVKIPIITDEEILSINTHYQEMVDEILKVQVAQKDMLIAKLIIERQDQEIKKLKESSINGILMNDYNMLARDYKKATKKLEKLQQRIDKATEYINSFDYYIPEDNVPELLSILKGK